MPRQFTDEDVIQIVSEMAGGVYDDYELPGARIEDIIRLTHGCLAYRVPFTWTPRMKGGQTHWRLRLMAHEGSGFTAPWILVPSNGAFAAAEGGKRS